MRSSFYSVSSLRRSLETEPQSGEHIATLEMRTYSLGSLKLQLRITSQFASIWNSFDSALQETIVSLFSSIRCTLCSCEVKSMMMMSIPQADTAVGTAAEGQGCGSSGLLQSGKHLHASAGLRESHRLSPQTSNHSSGPQGQVGCWWRFSSVLLFMRSDPPVTVCRIGEGRACWSLGNAHTALGNHEQAMSFADKHLEISKEVCVCVCVCAWLSEITLTDFLPAQEKPWVNLNEKKEFFFFVQKLKAYHTTLFNI